MLKKIIVVVIMVTLFISCSKSENSSGDKINKVVNKGEKNNKSGKKFILKKRELSDEEFTLKITPAKEIKKGEQFQILVDIETKKPFHINKDFPLYLKIGGNICKFDKSKYKKDSAKISETTLSFQSNGSCQEGGKDNLKGKVAFGLCTDTVCASKSIPFDIGIDVK